MDIIQPGKECSTDACSDMDESLKHSKWKKPDTKGYILYDSTAMEYSE